VILTNTFGANRIRLADHELAGPERRSIGWASRSRGGRGRSREGVWVDRVPVARLLMSGETTATPSRPPSVSRPRPCGGGARMVWSSRRCQMWRRRELPSGRPPDGSAVVACMVFDAGKNKDRTMMATHPSRWRTLVAAGADVIGSNCGQGIAGSQRFADGCAPLRTDRSGSRPTRLAEMVKVTSSIEHGGGVRRHRPS